MSERRCPDCGGCPTCGGQADAVWDNVWACCGEPIDPSRCFRERLIDAQASEWQVGYDAGFRAGREERK